jgi:hypothetical protein
MQIYGYTGTNGSCYGQAMTTIPGQNDDWNQGWSDGCLWQYITPITGTIVMYICLTSSVGNAQWLALT